MTQLIESVLGEGAQMGELVRGRLRVQAVYQPTPCGVELDAVLAGLLLYSARFAIHKTNVGARQLLLVPILYLPAIFASRGGPDELVVLEVLPDAQEHNFIRDAASHWGLS